MTAAMNMDKGPEKFSTGVAEFWLDADGIIRRVLHKGANVTVDDAKEGMKIMLALAGGITRPLLIDGRGMKSISIEARRYYTKEGPKHFSPVAVVTGSRLTKMIASFILKVNRPAIDIKIFSDESKAINWLKRQMK